VDIRRVYSAASRKLSLAETDLFANPYGAGFILTQMPKSHSVHNFLWLCSIVGDNTANVAVRVASLILRQGSESLGKAIASLAISKSALTSGFVPTLGLALAFALALASGPAAAQDSADAKKKAPEPAASSGPDATTATFGDWSIICAPRGDSPDRNCQINSAVMLRNQTAPFARIGIVRGGKDKPYRLIALIPVNVTTQAPVKIAVDSGKSEVILPLRSCVPGGCLADAELGKDLLQTLRTPAKAPGQLTVVDAAGKAASVSFSLRGLDAALDAYLKP
jgi:invasion protein IalB